MSGYPSDLSLAMIHTSELHVYRKTPTSLTLVVDELAFHRRWPLSFEYMSKTYYFKQGESVPLALKNKYSKAALYVERLDE